MLTLFRHPSYADALRGYRVVLDGNDVGTIRRGESLSLSAPSPGPHQIWVEIDWCRSNRLDFIARGEPLHFECGSNLTGWRLLLGAVYLFLPHKWCWMRLVTPA